MSPSNGETVALYGGTIYGHRDADAVVLQEGRVLAVGQKDLLLDRMGEGGRSIDLRGRAVVPGFIDAHIHLVHTGLVESGWRVDLAGQTREDVLEALRAAAAARAPGEWIIGYGWDESDWRVRTYLTREELDRIVPKHPVVAIRLDGHLLTANSMALELVPSSTPESLIDRFEGHLREEAVSEALDQIQPDRATVDEAVAAAARLCHRLGITSVHTMSLHRDLASFRNGRAERRLRVTVCPEIASLEKLTADGMSTGSGDAWVRFGGMKLFADGSIGARNAAVSEPFIGGGIGKLNHADDALASMIRGAEQAGWQTIIHAIGDRAIEQVLHAHQAVGSDRALRHRMEHFELPNAGQIERAARLGLNVCMQPNFIGNWSGQDSLYVDRLGVRRDRASNPLRQIVDVGPRLAFGSDGMPVSPLYGMHWAVNGPYPNQRLTAEEAVARYTAGGAWFGFEEQSKGAIEPGMLADLVVLDEDLSLHPEAIRDRTIEMTFVGGEQVYLAPDSPF